MDRADPNARIARRARDSRDAPPPSLAELIRIASDCLFPGEQRLEQMLDRIERLP